MTQSHCIHSIREELQVQVCRENDPLLARFLHFYKSFLKISLGTSLAVQCLRLHTASRGSAGSLFSRRTKTPQAPRCGPEIGKKMKKGHIEKNFVFSFLYPSFLRFWNEFAADSGQSLVTGLPWSLRTSLRGEAWPASAILLRCGRSPARRRGSLGSWFAAGEVV